MENDNKCKKCGVTSDEESLHWGWLLSTIEPHMCWKCWHETARERNLPEFSVGVVGDNSGWAHDETLASAIDFALSESELQDNIDMGLSINAPINGSYTATLIVRNSQLFLNVAELWDWHELEPDQRLKYLQSIVDQLDFKQIKGNANGVLGPKQTHHIEDKKFIHGHCTVDGDDFRHIPTDDTNTMTLCGKPVFVVSRGLVNATCPKCREIWHGLNPVDTDPRPPSDDERLTEYHEQQVRNRRYDEADTDE